MIILLGSHGTGKSTLIDTINKSRNDYYTSDGFSRPVKRSLIKANSFNEHLYQQMLNELTIWRYQQDVNKKCIYTRSIIDVIAYSRVLNPKLDIIELEYILLETKHLNQYFYIPVEFGIVDDGERMLYMQQEINDEIKYIIKEFNLKITDTLTGSVENRLSILSKYL